MSAFQDLADAYDPDDRCAPPPDDECTQVLSAIEVSFAIPVYVTSEQLHRLHVLIHEITDAPCNTPKAGVHWPSGYGSKPQWSRVDAAMLGVPAAPDAPFSGEPTFDDGTYFIETSARAFVSEKERDRKLKQRRKGHA